MNNKKRWASLISFIGALIFMIFLLFLYFYPVLTVKDFDYNGPTYIKTTGEITEIKRDYVYSATTTYSVQIRVKNETYDIDNVFIEETSGTFQKPKLWYCNEKDNIDIVVIYTPLESGRVSKEVRLANY